MRIRDWMDMTETQGRLPADTPFFAAQAPSGMPQGGGNRRVADRAYTIKADVALTLMRLREDGGIFCYEGKEEPDSRSERGREGPCLPEEHRHDYIEIAYAYRGQLRQSINGEEYSFEEGEFCIVDRGTSHCEIMSEAGNTIAFLCLAESFFDEPFLAMLDDYYVGKFLRLALRGQAKQRRFLRFVTRAGARAEAQASAREVETLLDGILAECEGGAKGSRYIVKGLTLRLLGILIDAYDSQLTVAQAESYDETIFMELDSYLKLHYRDISIEQLTEAFNYNPDFYNRLIRKRTGMTYSRYLQSIRLAAAERLLRESDRSIDEVASEVGYENKGYFYKLFRERNGMSPDEYRHGSS
jgi:AraC-like DNA-binding protein